jgi:ketosteroid isomerase-like protein
MKTLRIWCVCVAKMLCLTLLALTLTACTRTDPEKLLRSSIAEMEAAVKARDTSKVMSFLADDFRRVQASPSSEGMTKPDARRVLAAVLLTNPNIYANVTITDVKISGDSATAKLTVIAGGGTGLIPERAQSWDFATRWRLEGGKWLVYSAEWNELL